MNYVTREGDLLEGKHGLLPNFIEMYVSKTYKNQLKRIEKSVERYIKKMNIGLNKKIRKISVKPHIIIEFK